jgi:hypothetical protein
MSKNQYYEELDDLRDEERELCFTHSSRDISNHYVSMRLYYVQDRIDHITELLKTDNERQQDYYRTTREANEEKVRQQKEREDNIPKRALMLVKSQS